jgi:glycosyltransferase involved in cell wall biosynthesis
MEEPRKPEYIEYLHKLIEDLSLEKQIHLLGYVDKLVQLEIMKSCIAVIQPTLFEGGPGGGSVYDALGLGSPVILSDIPVNLEIPNDFSNIMYFKAGDSEELAEKMIQFGTAVFEPPKHEILWRISLNSRRTLAVRLMETIDQALRRNHGQI